jgi:adenine deaminase
MAGHRKGEKIGKGEREGFPTVDVQVEKWRKRVLVAGGAIPGDLVLKRGRVVNVFSGRILERDVSISDGVIAGVGQAYSGETEVDLGGKYLVPGLIDGHIHIESSMLVPSTLAAALAVHGTTTIISDPHEIANVMGIEGVRFMLRQSEALPVDVFFMAPSCVPATPLETAGAALSATDLAVLRDEPRILGLGEVMNFPGVLAGDDSLLEKVVLFKDQVIDGHCPSLGGHGLQAYITAGMRSDHETTSGAEALEKMESGMMIMIREGTSAKNLRALLPTVSPANSRRFCFVSDDLHPSDIEKRGHLDHVLRKAVEWGLEPATAIQMATLNPAEYFGLKDRGAVAPGYRADLVVLNDLRAFEVASVYKSGERTVENGALIALRGNEEKAFKREAMNIAPFHPENFRIPHPGGKARVINVIPGQILTKETIEEVPVWEGGVATDPERDILKLAVVERHRASGRIGLGLVRGFGLKQGALASSVAHDSHNIIAVGVGDRDLFRAVDEVRAMGGGIAVVRGDRILAKMSLEVAGLMSWKPLHTVTEALRNANGEAAGLGCALKEPIMAVSFLALPVIPELKLTDMGLVDVARFEIVSLFPGSG